MTFVVQNNLYFFLFHKLVFVFWKSIYNFCHLFFFLVVVTDKKENEIFLIYMEIQKGSGAKSYMTNGLLIYGEKFAHFFIYWEALPHIWICTRSHLNFLTYEKNLVFFFSSAVVRTEMMDRVCRCDISVIFSWNAQWISMIMWFCVCCITTIKFVFLGNLCWDPWGAGDRHHQKNRQEISFQWRLSGNNVCTFTSVQYISWIPV